MNSEERFRLVVEAAPNAMVMSRADGRIELVNAQAERVFGYARAELLGQPVEMLVPAQFRGHHPGLRQAFFGAPGTRPMGIGRDLYGLRKDGSEFPIEIGLNPIETEEGTMVLSAIVDITERRQKLADASYLAAIVESSDDAIIGKDLSGIIKSWNSGAAAIFGYKAEEIIGRHISLLFPPDRLAEEALIMAQVKRGERINHLETLRRRKDGTDINVSLTISPIHDLRGVIVGASKILRDVTERREAERALAHSEAEFRASFEASAVGRVLAEPDSRRIVRANNALASVLGYAAPQELIGRTMSELTWPEDRAVDAAEYALLFSGDSKAHIREQRYIRRDGTPLWVRVSTTLAWLPESSQPALAVIAIEDINARHQAQADLLATKRDLEKVVDERTLALNERDLLLREVYHRVKNNLQIVDSLLMMQARNLDDPQAKLALMGLSTRIFALGLVHQQLMGSPDLKTVDVAPFLSDLSHNILDGAATSAVRVAIGVCPLYVGLDFAVPLGLLVTELVTNSLKHAFPEGTGNISVILRPGSRGNLVLIVSDDGSGEAAKAVPLGTRKGLGTGIIKSLVTQLQGTMKVRKENGMTTEIEMPMPVSS